MFGIHTAFDDANFLSEVVARSKTPNGVFGIKMMWPHMEELKARKQLSPDWREATDFIANLKYIYITRADDLAQAISFLMATRTHVWQRIATSEECVGPRALWASTALQVARQMSSTPPVVTDNQEMTKWTFEQIEAELAHAHTRRAVVDEIARWRDYIRAHNANWQNLFAREHLQPLRVTYEQLMADPRRAMADIKAFLQLEECELPDYSPRLLPLRDQRNSALTAAYHAEFPTS
jgi:LPS sulfotransferase NodH